MALSNNKTQDNLQDSLHYTYTEQGGQDYVSAMIIADTNETFAFAIITKIKVIGSLYIFR